MLLYWREVLEKAENDPGYAHKMLWNWRILEHPPDSKSVNRLLLVLISRKEYLLLGGVLVT